MNQLTNPQANFLKKVRYRLKVTVGNTGQVSLIHRDYPNRMLYEIPTLLNTISRVLMTKSYNNEERNILMDLRESVKWNIISIENMHDYPDHI